MTNYLIELSLIHTALMLGYWFLLRKEYQYAKMRFYLLGSTLLALVVPLLKLPKFSFASEELYSAVTVESIPLDSMSVVRSSHTTIWESDLWLWTYLAISLFLLCRFLGSVCYLIYLDRKSRHEKFDDRYVRRIHDIQGSFTFFNWVFISDVICRDKRQYAMILKHEKAHVALGHSYDLVCLELFKICFWWLPTAWLSIREIKKIHEYQADAYALKSYTIDQYSSVLISSTLKPTGLSLTSSFHDGFIFNRLMAMKQHAREVSIWKLGILASMFLVLLIVFACSEEQDQEITVLSRQSHSITFDQLPPSMQKDMADIKDNLSFIKVDVFEDERTTIMEELQGLDPYLIHVKKGDQMKGTVYLALEREGANLGSLVEEVKHDGEILTAVEELPEFEGGMDAFYKYVTQAIKYPIHARRNGVEGRVDVQFVVEKDGSLSDVTAVEGIGFGCDREATRVVRDAPWFRPGRQRDKPVRVMMILPIVFELSKDKVNADHSKQGIIIVQKAKLNNRSLNVDARYSDGHWSGTVLDEEGRPLAGAHIVVSGTTIGTTSDHHGTFKVKAQKSEGIVVSFVGYQSESF